MKKLLLRKNGFATTEAVLVIPLVIFMCMILAMAMVAIRQNASVNYISFLSAVSNYSENEDVYNSERESISEFTRVAFIKTPVVSEKSEKGSSALKEKIYRAEALYKEKYILPWIGKKEKEIRSVYALPIYNSSEYSEDEEDSIWFKHVFVRGREIEKFFGGNMPDGFEAVDIYDADKTATMILSIDVTSDTYKTEGNLLNYILGKAEKIIMFHSDTVEGVTLSEKDILKKKILIVIPDEDISELCVKELETAKQVLWDKGIEMEVEKYQKKWMKKNE